MTAFTTPPTTLPADKLTDAIADFLFVTEESGVENLRKEGVAAERIFLVGNVMIDCMLHYRTVAGRSGILRQLNVLHGDGHASRYGVLTLHRPSNVDDPKVLDKLLGALSTVAEQLPIFFSVHPRTRERVLASGSTRHFRTADSQPPEHGLIPLDPLPYLDFLCLMDHAALVLTDSGGIQEETTVLGIPCLTLRENTERPATVEQGSNQLIGLNPERLITTASEILQGNYPKGRRPPLWDGHAAQRIVKVLVDRLRPVSSTA